jgi:hypothetical protein
MTKRGRLRLVQENPLTEASPARQAAPFSPELQRAAAEARPEEWIFVEGDRLTHNARMALLLAGRPVKRRRWWRWWEG